MIVLDAKEKKLMYKALEGEGGGTKGELLLDVDSVVEPLPANNSAPAAIGEASKYCFVVIAATGSIELACEDEETQKAWIDAIKGAINQDMIAEAKIQKKIYVDFVKRKGADGFVQDDKEARDAKDEMALIHKKMIERKNKANELRRKHLVSYCLSAAASLFPNTLLCLLRPLPPSSNKIASPCAQPRALSRLSSFLCPSQVRQNFRAAVKRAAMQHKIALQLKEGANGSEKDGQGRKSFSKHDEINIFFAQGDNDDDANAIEKILMKKKLEREMQQRLNAPAPDTVVESFRKSTISERESFIPGPPPLCDRRSTASVPPPPPQPRPPRPPPVENTSKLFVSVPSADGSEFQRVSDVSDRSS